MPKSRVLFITLAEVLIARNLFYTDFWPAFLSKCEGWKIVLLVHKEKEEVYRARFASDQVEVVGIRPIGPGRAYKLFHWLMFSGVNTHTNRWERMRAYVRGRASLPNTFFKGFLSTTLGNSNAYKRWLRSMVVRWAKPNTELAQLFDTYAPEVVILTSFINYDLDVHVGVESRRRKIKTLGMPRSWDNFTSHGLTRVIPDELFLQNTYLQQTAVTHQAVTKETPIHIFGLPHYDIYKRAANIVIPKEELFKKLGLDPQKKLLTYGAMGDYLFPHEGRVAPALDRILKKQLGESAQVLFRAHPYFLSPLAAMKELQHVRPDLVALHVDKSKPEHELGEEETQHFVSSLYWSDIVITSASTFAIDGVALGKPVICIAYDLDENPAYWYSNKRFYDSYTHFEALVETGGVTVVRSDAELERAIETLLAKPEVTEGMQRLLDLFVEPFDGKAGERLALQLSESLVK